MQDILQTSLDLGRSSASFVSDIFRLAGAWTLAIFWALWCLFAIDWRKLWPTLAAGAGPAVVLLGLMIAAAWSLLDPRDVNCWGLKLSNFIWQILAVGLVIGFTLLCGWLQMRYGWFPHEVPLAGAEDHGHAHGHDEHGHHE